MNAKDADRIASILARVCATADEADKEAAHWTDGDLLSLAVTLSRSAGRLLRFVGRPKAERPAQVAAWRASLQCRQEIRTDEDWRIEERRRRADVDAPARAGGEEPMIP